jgi:hypothetical protein
VTSQAFKNVRDLDAIVSVTAYGAKGDGVTDDTSAINAALAASKRLFFPAGIYRISSTLTISNVNGLVLEGSSASLEAAGVTYPNNAVLSFDASASGTDGLVITNFVGVTIRNLVISQRRNSTGGGRALYMHTGHDFVLENVKVDSATGATGKGIVLGNGTSATAAFLGTLTNCKVFAQGGNAFESNASNTTLTFTGCYQVGGKFKINGTYYSTLNSCASEVSLDFGYDFNGCSNITINSCGGEGNAKGVFFIQNSTTNCILNAPYGANNNTSGDNSIGDLVNIDSSVNAVNAITIVNPTSLLPNAATTANIRANSGTGFVEVLNTDLTLLSFGVGGDATWQRDKLTTTGRWDELKTWTPVLSNWTNVGTPSIVGKYKRVGKVVTFFATITPGTSISATISTSSITGFPFSSLEAGAATMHDANVISYGVCAIGASGIIYPQTSGVLTVPVTFVGTAILS